MKVMPNPMAASLPRSQTLAERVYQGIKENITGFSLLPGDHFTEAQVCAWVGASRTPVRQALHRLQQDGFLEVHARSGWRVRPLDFDRFDALYELRIVLEEAAVRRVCAHSDDHAAQILQQLHATWLVPATQRQREMQRVAALDEQFHVQLVQAAGNAEMARVHRDVTDSIRIVRSLDFTEGPRIDATYQEHASILQAVLGNRPGEACRLLRAHIEISRSEVRRITLHRLQSARRPWQGRVPVGAVES